ncbi:type I polyketide synthase, partial [Streptomyces sp. NPDC101158]|uniref:type I polyketide synthase n=1 Tax=Streptomyces sp. NPDC101158 TaxID=3366117 RepID=UPI00380858D7
GTALLDMALYAAEVTGYGEVAELVIGQPLTLPAHGAVDVQVQVTAAGDRAELTLHSRPADDTETSWTTHATGTLVGAPAAAPSAAVPETWPPTDAKPLDTDDLYVELLDQGYAYGPAFQGLRAAWRHGDDVYAEIVLPEDVTAERHPVHPALLDAALHGLRFGVHGDRTHGSRPVLPFAWQGVRLFRTGASHLRVRLSARGADAVHVEFADAAGQPVGAVESLVLREAPEAVVRVSDTLFEVTWTPATPAPLAGTDPVPVVSPAELAGAHGSVVVADCVPGGGPVPTAALELAVTVLGTVRDWLADPARAGATLILVTRGAAGPDGDTPTEVAAAPVWGLVRAAQSEHPGRFVLVDADDPRTVDAEVWRRVAASGEPEWAVRDGRWYQARIGRLAAPASAPLPATGPDDEGAGSGWGGGTVLITGGTGGLGALVARHLVASGVSSLVLVSRRGEGAPGARELVEELSGAGVGAGAGEAIGAATGSGSGSGSGSGVGAGSGSGAVRVRVVACDVSDRDALAVVVGGIGDLTGVVHAAGVADNGMVTGMSAERLGAVLAAKADAAWHLHELTASLPLSAFVLFSSVGGSLLAGGQSAYAAANVFLDALAAHRHAQGLPATSLAYALWQTETGLSQWLSEIDLQRMRRTGMPPLTEREGLADLDAAVAAGRPAVLSMHLDLPTLRRLPELPHPMLRALVPAPRAVRAASGGPGRDDALRRRLHELSGAEQLAELRRLVLGRVAAVLGFDDEADVDPRRDFLESGFDSLAAIELRNQLNKALGLQLPAMAVFDGQNPEQLAALVQAELAAVGAGAGAGTAPVPDVDPDPDPRPHLASHPRPGSGHDNATVRTGTGSGTPPEGGAAPVASPEPGAGADSLSGLFREAVLAGKVGQAFGVLRAVAELRDSFDSEGMTTPLASARLGDGPGGPRIVCVSTPMAGGGLHQHARLASHLRGARPVSALALPGFAATEPLPASAEAVVHVMAENVLAAAEGRPFVLLGYSSGGLIAYATAHHLERVHGVVPAGVVLLDTYRVQDEAMVVGMDRLARSLLEVERTVGRYDSTRLSAMSRYFDILPDFTLDAVSAPVLFVTATGDFLDRTQYEGDAGDLKARPWDPDHVLRTAPGSHFTLIQDDAASTAAVVEDWVGQL